MADAGWRADVLPGFEALTLPLPGARVEAGEPEEVVATLVRRSPTWSGSRTPRPALLYVHGWNDYFFQAHLGDAADAAGYDLYALDLRRYGRSLRPGQLGGYVTDLAEYDVELDLARGLILDAGHPAVVLHGHSTGGLVTSTHLARRPGEYAALVLNSPWLDMAHQPAIRALARPLGVAGAYRPTSVLPMSETEEQPGMYARSLHASLDGEWDYDLAWKSNPDVFKVRLGWLRAVLRAQRQVSRGLDIAEPILCVTSDATVAPREFDVNTMMSGDAVLDVRTLGARAVRLGRHVTVAQVAGGVHDLALSRPAVRRAYADVVTRWLGAYGPA